MRTLALTALIGLALAGCIQTPAGDAAPAAASDTQPEPAEPQRIEWQGHITHYMLDGPAHMKDPERVLFPIQQAGFLVEIDTQPTAIEVMVSWNKADAGFRLHPHYTAHHDPELGGDTLYYGYFSDMFDQSPGCIRIPADDMAAGTWPVMIHPQSGTTDTDYTITVGIQGATGHILDPMHGHRTDGRSPVEDHGVAPCQFLNLS